MNLKAIIHQFEEAQANAEAERNASDVAEGTRRRLNAEKVSENISTIIEPVLAEAASEINRAGYEAAVTTTKYGDGRIAVGIKLSACRTKGLSSDSQHHLRYKGDDNAATITADIGMRRPTMNPFQAIGVFPVGSLTAKDIEAHVEALAKLVFPASL